MRLVLSLAATLTLSAMGLLGADQSWTGTISDSHCGGSHGSTPAKQCTTGCVKKGAKYVIVVGDKVYSIANQESPGLAKFAGDNVTVTGKMDGDTITVAKIDKAS
jgi:hypothetical protein